MPKPRVHEIAHELGVDSKTALLALRNLGEYAKGPSSSIEPAVARKLRAALTSGGFDPKDAPFTSLHGPGARRALAALRAGAAGLPDLVQTLGTPRQTDAERLIANIARDRYFLFSPAGTTRIAEHAIRGSAFIFENEFPAPRGIALLQRPPATDWPPLWSLMTWEFGGALRTATAYLVISDDGNLRCGYFRERTSPMRPDGSFQVDRVLLGLIRSVPERPDRPSTTAVPRPVVPTPRDVIAGDAGGVIVRALTRSPAATLNVPIGTHDHDAAGAGTRTSPRHGRWPVRGHWREQWYSSTEEHKRIWIADHTAGEPDGELRARDVVHVVRPKEAQRDPEDGTTPVSGERDSAVVASTSGAVPHDDLPRAAPRVELTRIRSTARAVR